MEIDLRIPSQRPPRPLPFRLPQLGQQPLNAFDQPIHRVDLFIKCLRDKLGSGVLISRDMLLEGDLAMPRDIVNIIVG